MCVASVIFISLLYMLYYVEKDMFLNIMQVMTINAIGRNGY